MKYIIFILFCILRINIIECKPVPHKLDDFNPIIQTILDNDIHYHDIERNLLEAIDIIKESCVIERDLKYSIILNNNTDYLMAVNPAILVNNDTIYSYWLYNYTSLIDATFRINKNIDWALSDDEATDNNYHMRSAFLHELIHVMGFNSYIYSNFLGLYNTIYDKSIMYNDEKLLDFIKTNNESYSWIGKDIFIDGVQLYNPFEYKSGSSISHIESVGFKSVMSYTTYPGKIHTKLDDKVIRILKKIGWNCTYNYENDDDIIIIINDDNDKDENTKITFRSVLYYIYLGTLGILILCIFVIFIYICYVKNRFQINEEETQIDNIDIV